MNPSNGTFVIPNLSAVPSNSMLTIPVEVETGGNNNIIVIANLVSENGTNISGCGATKEIQLTNCEDCSDIVYNVVIDAIECTEYPGSEIATVNGRLIYTGPFPSILYRIEHLTTEIFVEDIIDAGTTAYFTMEVNMDNINNDQTFDYSVSFFNLPNTNPVIDCCFDYTEFIDCDSVNITDLEIVDCHDGGVPNVPSCPSDICSGLDKTLYVIDESTNTLLSNADYDFVWTDFCGSNIVRGTGNPWNFGDYFDGRYNGNEEVCVCVKAKNGSECLWTGVYTLDCCKEAPVIECDYAENSFCLTWFPIMGDFQQIAEFDVEISGANCLNGCSLTLNPPIIFQHDEYVICESDLSGELNGNIPDCFTIRVRRNNCGAQEDQIGEWSNYFTYCGETSCNSTGLTSDQNCDDLLSSSYNLSNSYDSVAQTIDVSWGSNSGQYDYYNLELHNQSTSATTYLPYLNSDVSIPYADISINVNYIAELYGVKRNGDCAKLDSTNWTFTSSFNQSSSRRKEVGDAKNHVLVYPNPFNHSVKIQVSTHIEDFKLRVLTPDGKELITSNSKESREIDLDTNDWVPGLYIFVIEDLKTGKLYYNRVVKMR